MAHYRKWFTTAEQCPHITPISSHLNTFEILNRMTLVQDDTFCTVGGQGCLELANQLLGGDGDGHHHHHQMANIATTSTTQRFKTHLKGHYLCLSCLQVFCGRNVSSHALQHYEQSKGTSGQDGTSNKGSSSSSSTTAYSSIYHEREFKQKEQQRRKQQQLEEHSHCVMLACDTLECWCYECDSFVSSKWFEQTIVTQVERALRGELMCSVKQSGQLLNGQAVIWTERDSLLSELKSCFDAQSLLCDVRFVWPAKENLSQVEPDNSHSGDTDDNVTHRCGVERELKAHRFILSLRCPVFRSMFTSNMLESQVGVMNDIVIENYSYESFYAFINYLYTGTIPITTGNVIELLAISTEYMMTNLRDQCSSTILAQVENDNDMLCQMFELIGPFDESLEKQLLNLIANHAQQVVQCNSFLELSEDNVKRILQNTVLMIESESYLLRAVIAWANYQFNNGLRLDVNDQTWKENEEEYLHDHVLLQAKSVLELILFDSLNDSRYHPQLKQFATGMNRERLCLRLPSWEQCSTLYRKSHNSIVISHRETTWRSYTLPMITLLPHQLFALSVTIDHCDHHGNIRIGFSNENTLFTFYGYNGMLYRHTEKLENNLKFGVRDRVTLLLDHRRERAALFKDDETFMELHFCKVNLRSGKIEPTIQLYAQQDSVRVHKSLSPQALQKITLAFSEMSSESTKQENSFPRMLSKLLEMNGGK